MTTQQPQLACVSLDTTLTLFQQQTGDLCKWMFSVKKGLFLLCDTKKTPTGLLLSVTNLKEKVVRYNTANLKVF